MILLAGRFRGKRAVFLKQLASGLLLVTGPYKINGVPLRRVNQAYVIATETRVDVAKVDVTKIDDAFFAKKKDGKSGKFFTDAAKKEPIAAARLAAQKQVDGALLSVVKKTAFLPHYLNAKFSLTNGQYPHNLKF